MLLLYGERFGDFLDDFAPAAGVPYLGDVARLEWARLYAYHAADAQPLAIERLAEIPAGDLEAARLRFHPSLRLLTSRFPVASLWAATTGADPSAEVDMKQSEAVAVLRPGFAVDLRVLPQDGYEFLAWLAEGRSLGEAADALVRISASFDLAHHLQGLFQMGAVVSIETSSSNSQQS